MMPTFKLTTLPADALIHEIIEAAGGDPNDNRWDGEEGAWYVDAPTRKALDAAVKAYDHDAARLPLMKMARLAELAVRRWRVETAGVEVLGLRVSTSRESQSMVHSAQLAASRIRGRERVNFKALDGWKVVTVAEMDQIWQAVAAHVQACFSRECDLAAKINAATTVAELESIELEF